jgi:hypothetical protein
MIFFIGCNSTDEQKLQDLMGVATNTKLGLADLGNQAFDFNPSTYNFGSRAVNSAPVTTTITIRNKYTKRLFISSISGLSGAFSLVSDNCPRSPSSIDPDSTCSATVSFAPTTAIAYSSSLTISYGEIEGQNTYTASMGISGTGTGSLSFTGIDSVSDIYSTQLKLNWTNDASALVYYVFKVNNDNSVTLLHTVLAPATSKIVSGLTANTSYRLWVRATGLDGNFDANSNVVTTSTNNTPPSPVLYGFANYIFPSSEIRVGSTMSFDMDDNRTGTPSDANVTYNCSYDQVVDSAVVTTGNCSSLPGTASFNASTGAISWTPTSNSTIGVYEFKVILTDSTSALNDIEYFTVNVAAAYSQTNLLVDLNAIFANTSQPHTTGTTWEDVSGNNYDGTLTNFTFGGSYGWKGAGASSNPYRLVFDGTNDYVDLGSTASTATDLTFESWFKPTSTTSSGYVISNGDSSAKGITLREARGYRNRIEAIIGNYNYADEMMADSPFAYFRGGENSGDTPFMLGSSTASWTLSGVSSYELTSPLGGNDKALGLSGGGGGYKSNASIESATWGGLTFETWFKIDSYAGISYPTFFTYNSQSAANTFYWLFMNGPNNLYFQYVGDGVVRNAAVAFTPVVGTWYHLAISFNFTTKLLNMYVNGNSIYSNIEPCTTIRNDTLNSTIRFANYGDIASHSINGGMDEVALYNTALSTARIQAHYNAKVNYYSIISNRIPNNVFNHVASKYQSTTQTLSLYTNANLDAAVSTGAISINGTTANLSLGAKLPSAGNPTAGSFTAGEIATARVYNSALSQATLKSNMASEVDLYDIPKSISGLNLWLKADALTGYSNGDAVTTWTDSSISARNATQATASKKPTYIASSTNGKPALRFDGVDDEMTIGGAGNSWTVFIVAKQITTSGATKHYAMGTGIMAYLASAISGNLYWYQGPPNWASYSLIGATGTSYHVQTFRANASLAEAWLDGVKGLTYAGTYTAGPLVTIGNYTGDTRWINADIAEIISYSGTLTDAERLLIEGYLKAKYNL